MFVLERRKAPFSHRGLLLRDIKDCSIAVSQEGIFQLLHAENILVLQQYLQ